MSETVTQILFNYQCCGAPRNTGSKESGHRGSFLSGSKVWAGLWGTLRVSQVGEERLKVGKVVSGKELKFVKGTVSRSRLPGSESCSNLSSVDNSHVRGLLRD